MRTDMHIRYFGRFAHIMQAGRKRAVRWHAPPPKARQSEGRSAKKVKKKETQSFPQKMYDRLPLRAPRIGSYHQPSKNRGDG